MRIEVREVPNLCRVVVARKDGDVLILHPPEYDKGDLEWLLKPSEVALLRAAV